VTTILDNYVFMAPTGGISHIREESNIFATNNFSNKATGYLIFKLFPFRFERLWWPKTL